MIKKLILKLNLIMVMLAVSAGVIYFACGFAFLPRVPKNVKINGLDVGGYTRVQAARAVRKQTEDYLKGKTLKIVAGSADYTFSYPEIYYKDNLFFILKNAKKNAEYTVETSYYLCGANEIAAGICLSESKFTVEPYAKFSAYGAPFEYFEGNDGREADEKQLIDDINKALNGGFEEVFVKFNVKKRTQTIENVKEQTRLLSSFTTNFDGSNLNRVSNIRLAAAKLNGIVLNSQKTLSFNDTVGARVKERGFLSAKIIENGEFIEGVGGGVCQVSTTLYNAALLGGMKIAEYHPHSLAVGYVPPSRDAMVSGKAFDLKITNTAKTPVYIRAHTTNGSVTFDVYGKPDGTKYSLISAVTGSIPAPEEYTDNPEKERAGKDGLLSESYIEITSGGTTQTKLLRKDKYMPVKKRVYGGTEEKQDENPA